jgi:ribonuclease J
VLDRYGSLLAAPQLSTVGAIDLERVESGRGAAVGAVEDAIEALDDDAALDDERIREAVRGGLRRGLGLARERRPIVEIQITRLGREALAGLHDAEAVT